MTRSQQYIFFSHGHRVYDPHPQKNRFLPNQTGSWASCKNFTGQATITTATTARRRMYNNYKKREHIAAQRSVAFFMSGRGRVLRRPNKFNAHSNYLKETDEH